MDSKTLINALLRPDTYPHPVDTVELIETHISWVFLTGDFAYKVKKPVDFGFLNFSTLKKRQFFCGEELRLNSRYAPEIYLNIAAITLQNGVINLKNIDDIIIDKQMIDSSTEIIDYAVKMHQFDTSSTLDILAEKEGLNADTVHQIGRNLAEFHHQLMADELPADNITPPPGSPDAVWAPVAENFSQITPLLKNQPHLQTLAAIERFSTESYNSLKPLLQQRYNNGFIRECHGDLHLGNMAKVPAQDSDQGVLFFDCIEFNVNFRQIDVICELAFTLMDLEARGMPAQANSLLNTYLEYRDDFDGLKLLNFYKTYYAIVRAKVSLLETGSSDPAEIEAHHKYNDFVKYITLAKNYSATNPTFIAITHGISGSGKSTIAEKVAGVSGAIRIRSDVERKRLFGLQPHEASDKSIYNKDASQKTFQRLQSLMVNICKTGFAVVIDATFIHQNRRDEFYQQACKLNQPLWILDCQAPGNVLEQRLKERVKASHDASEADIEIMKSQQRHQQPLNNDELKRTITIDTTQDINTEVIVTKLTD